LQAAWYPSDSPPEKPVTSDPGEMEEPSGKSPPGTSAADGNEIRPDRAEQPQAVQYQPFTWPVRIVLLAAGVVAPVVCFVVGRDGIPMLDAQKWQSGELRVYAALLVAFPSSAVFYPFLLYSMTCLGLIAFAPARYAPRFWVRFGIFSGVLLVIHFLIIVLTHLLHPQFIGYSLLAVGIPAFVVWILRLLERRFGPRRVWLPMLGLALGAGLVFLAVRLQEGALLKGLRDLLTGAAVLCMLFGTPWAAAAYSFVAFYLLGKRWRVRLQLSLRQLLGVFTWLAAYLAAWRWSLNLMLAEYAQLPEEKPAGCYVCTAAARGHRRLVGREWVKTAGGRFPVSEQMRTLKAAELVLRRLSPRAHRMVRCMYDRWGPPLANRLRRPLAADAAYVSLKPFQWLARATLLLLVARSREAIARLYPEEQAGPRPGDR